MFSLPQPSFEPCTEAQLNTISKVSLRILQPLEQHTANAGVMRSRSTIGLFFVLSLGAIK